jgi:hypothetical protein
MMAKPAILALVLGFFSAATAQKASPDPNPLARHYRDGESLVYSMKAVNESWHYSIKAEGTVGKDAAGNYFEEYGWSGLVSDGQPIALPAQSQTFRQRLSLDPNSTNGIPNLSQVDPRLIGPITDFLTFYADLWLAIKTGQLAKAGDHLYVPNGAPSSWADGTNVLLGESSIDFDLTLQSVDRASQTAVLVVRHVPPAKTQVHLPAVWMQNPVAGTPNNWVLVGKTPDGKYTAQVGKETFTVDLRVSLADGKILSASMDNPVKTIARICDDQALTQCGPAQPHEIERKIEIALEPPH